MDTRELESIARQMVAPGKGILAADESMATIVRRFESVDIPQTPENRRLYRQVLFGAQGMEKYIGGVILFEESLSHCTDDGIPFTRLLQDRGIVPGIKVDAGFKPLAGFPGESITEGLDGLRERLARFYADHGTRFTKWRAVIKIEGDLPTAFCIEANMHALARYAALVQEAGMVPIVEPEVMMDGDHTIERCAEVSRAGLKQLFDQLRAHRVHLPGTVLKPNMIVPGKDCPAGADVDAVADATVSVLRDAVPEELGGIAFLSGGQKPQPATAHLQAINARGPHPWPITFSYARALQEPALEAWRGRPENVAEARRKFLHRARCNGAAHAGRYREADETAVTA